MRVYTGSLELPRPSLEGFAKNWKRGCLQGGDLGGWGRGGGESLFLLSSLLHL